MSCEDQGERGDEQADADNADGFARLVLCHGIKPKRTGGRQGILPLVTSSATLCTLSAGSSSGSCPLTACAEP